MVLQQGFFFLLTMMVTISYSQTEHGRFKFAPPLMNDLEEYHCGKCQPEACPTRPDNCIAGIMFDECACCKVCGRSEGQRCNNNTHPLLRPSERHGLCGEGLVCLRRDDLRPTEGEESLCVCIEKQMACGEDGETYSSICNLREESRRRRNGQGINLQYWGPCKTAPWIVTGPETTTVPANQRVALDCEAKGFPTPLVRWEFIATDGRSRTLPSDNSLLAVQLRGGPEHYMVTSWLQMMDIKPDDQGNYTCIASNSEGEARATAIVYVYKK